MNFCVVLTKLQPFHGKRSSNESEKAHPNEEARAYERARQQNARDEMTRWKEKAKNIKSPTPSTSEKPLYSHATSSPLPSNTQPSNTPPSNTKNADAAHARALQAQLDSERASYELARRMQAQEEAAQQDHRRLLDEAARVSSFDCVICMESYPVDYSAPIRSCGHTLCRMCMKEHVESQVSESIWPIRCPTCVADHSRTEAHGGQHLWLR